MSVRFDAAARALERDRKDDLRGVRVTALGFKLVVAGAHPIALVHGVDEDGVEHWFGVRDAGRGVEAAYAALLWDLVRRGLTVTRPLIVDTGGCSGLARRVEFAFGPVVYAGVARECGGCGLAW